MSTLPVPLKEYLAAMDAESDSPETDCDKHFEALKTGCVIYDPEQKNVDILWRLARAAYRAASKAEIAGDKSKQVKLLNEGEKFIQTALDADKDGENFDVQAWAAYLCCKLADHVGRKERIERGKRVQTLLENCLKIRKDDAIALYTYGRWCIEVARLSYLERKLAAALFSAIPEASYADALKYFKDADQHKRDWRANYFHMAKCNIASKDYQAAITNLDLAVKCSPIDDEDRLCEKELLNLQKKYSSYR